MNARRSQLQWPAAAVAAITLLGLALALSVFHRGRSGGELGQINRPATLRTPRSLKDDPPGARVAPRRTYKVDLLPAGALRQIQSASDADGYVVDAVDRPAARHGFAPAKTSLTATRATANLPPEAVRRWLLPLPRSEPTP